MYRQSKSTIEHGIVILRGLSRLIKDMWNGGITFKQAYLVIYGRIINPPKLNDDFEWGRYRLYYEQELISVGKSNTLLPKIGDFEYASPHIGITKIKPLSQGSPSKSSVAI